MTNNSSFVNTVLAWTFTAAQNTVKLSVKYYFRSRGRRKFLGVILSGLHVKVLRGKKKKNGGRISTVLQGTEFQL